MPITIAMWCSTSSTVSANSSRIALDRVAELVDLAVGEARRRLVHQQEARPGGEGPGDLEALERAERAVRPPGGTSAWPSPSCAEQLAGDVARRGGPRASTPMRRSPARSPTLPWLWAPTITFSSSVIDGNRARFWNVRAMPRLAMPWAGTASRSRAVEVHRARGRVVDPADDVEHRRLAGAVGPDQAADLALVDREGEPVERDDAAEAHRDVLHLHEWHQLLPRPRPSTPPCAAP